MHNPLVPETLEGWSLLHLMYRVRWDRLNALPEADRCRLADEAVRGAGAARPGRHRAACRCSGTRPT